MLLKTLNSPASPLRLNWHRFGGLGMGLASWALVAALINLFGWWVAPALLALVVYLFWDDAKHIGA